MRRSPVTAVPALALAIFGAALGFTGLSAGEAEAAPRCTGANITGAGSSVQRIAQQSVWASGFSASACPGGPEVGYESIGSGAGLARWGALGGSWAGSGTAFIGTDEAPTASQITSIRTAAGGGAHVLVVPVAQAAIAVIVHPPAGCELEEITNQQLESVWRGIVKRWDKIDTASGAGCVAAPITRIVRKDDSGTTYQFKRYLGTIGLGKLACTNPSRTWTELAPITGTEDENVVWPVNGSGGCLESTLSPVVRPASGGGVAEVEKVNATAGSIGYAALPDVEATAEAGVTHSLKLQNNGLVKLVKATFAEPSVEAWHESNCYGAKYTVPAAGRVGGGSGLDVDWAQVFGASNKVGGDNYPLCGLSYVVTLDGSHYSSAGFSAGVGVSVFDYVDEYLVRTVGQEDLLGNFYAPPPSATSSANDVLGAARHAAEWLNTPRSRIYWGADVDGDVYLAEEPGGEDAPWGASTWDRFEEHAGKGLSILHFGQPPPWEAARHGEKLFAEYPLDLTRERGAIPMITMATGWLPEPASCKTEPGSPKCKEEEKKWEKDPELGRVSLAEINSGTYDKVFEEWAKKAAEYEHPFFLRWAWEMNGWWYRWGREAKESPELYVAVWRRLHDIAEHAGAKNVTWVWCPNVSGSETTSLKSLWPGDAYVDWTCMDGYNRGGTSWESFSEVFSRTYEELRDVGDGKPIMIGETASSEIGGSKPAWIEAALGSLPGSFPGVNAFVWFNWNIVEREGEVEVEHDWPIESSMASTEAFASGISTSYYAPGEFGFLPGLESVAPLG
jgi:ABC-type phosphate transport system substrate-binding protein